MFPDETTFLAWTAAWLDCEGSISYPRVKGRRTPFVYYAAVDIHNTDIRPLQLIRNRFGGNLTVQCPERRKPLFRYQITSRKAIKFLQAIHKFLIVKRKLADVLIRHYKKKHRCCRNRGYSEEMWKEEEQTRLAIMKLNNSSPTEVEAYGRILQKRKRRFWSDADTKFLLENHSTSTIAEIAKKLNRTRKSVANKIDHLGLGEKKCG